jgi:type II secretory pathway pseudopilin PulG
MDVMNDSVLSITKRKAKGLTLIEVLVSIAFAAILLSALSVPLAMGLINRIQGRKLTEATNLAQAQVEAIRASWSVPTPVIAGTATPTIGQQNFDNNRINISWNTLNATQACPPTPVGEKTIYAATNKDLNYSDATKSPKLLTDPYLVAPNNVNIPSVVKAIEIDADGKPDLNGKCTQDYWGQIMFGNAPDDNTGVALKDTKRVVVRIFTLEEDPKALNIALAPTVKLSAYSLNPNQQNLGLPLVVLIADIPRP